jgi:hypothetical protein
MDPPLRPLCLLLLPEPLERFGLRDQAEELLQAQDVVAVDPPRIPYAALAKLPLGLAQGMAGRVARRLVKTLRRNGDRPRVLVIFHPVQVLHAHAVLHLVPGCELWYGRMEPSEADAQAGSHYRQRLDELDEVARRLATRTFVPSEELARLDAAVPPAQAGGAAP